MNDGKTLKDYMSKQHRELLGNRPTTHKNCTEVTRGVTKSGKVVKPGVSRPGKTARERAKRRAMIEDLHFHDLRHEAISRFFEMGLSIPEVALISGHKDYRMLARYTHLRAEDLVGRLG